MYVLGEYRRCEGVREQEEITFTQKIVQFAV
jgi:hypothetical protein